MESFYNLKMKDLVDVLPIGGFIGASLSGYIHNVRLGFTKATEYLSMAKGASDLLLVWLQIIAAGLAIYVAFQKLKTK